MRYIKKNYSRDFKWLSSVSGDTKTLTKLNNNMLRFYNSIENRSVYQKMLSIHDDEEKIVEDSMSILLSKYICNSDAKNILEVGCGDGRIYRRLCRLGYIGKYCGIDITENIIDLNQKNHPEVEWKYSNAYNIPFVNSSLDLIYLLYVLEHLVYPEKALKEMMRVLKPGGELVLVFPDFVKSGRFASQMLGFSSGLASEKFSRFKILDGLISLYDSRLRLPIALKNAVKKYGPFPVNSNPKCLVNQGFMSPDTDAIYISSKIEVSSWATQSGYKVYFPYGSNGNLSNQSFLVITK